MKPKIRTLWTNALESGEYIQGAGQLCIDGKYCCLGVLCDLAVKAGVINPGTDVTLSDGIAKQYGLKAETGFLPDEVKDWAGIEYSDPYVAPDGKSGHTNQTFSMLNDSHVPFTEIAKKIKEYL